MGTDCYDEIHHLLREKKYGDVLRLICSKDKKHLNNPYSYDSNHGWYIVGNIHYKKGDYDFAISAFKKSISARNDDDEALMALANCYTEINRADRAEKYLKEAVKVAPSKEVYIYNLANALFDQEKYAEAAKMYQSITEKDPDLFGMAQKNYKLACQNL